jgi:nicotinate-nucleotide adenylyltransferase
MKIAVYGGSFNPPHIAHAMVSSWLLWTETVEQVWMVPVCHHAFEDTHGKKLADFNLRISWCKTFQKDINSRIIVSDIESKLPTPNYTIDTLEHFANENPDDEFRLVVGADVLTQINEWKDWEIISKKFSPIVVGRLGYECPPNTVEFPAISSSQIRAFLSKGTIPNQFLTRSIQNHLKEYNPYAK